MKSHKRKLQKIYSLLYSEFGPQGWWPAKTSFEVIVGAILTQNTSWGNVERAIRNLKSARVLSVKKLRSLPQAELARLIRPAGYFNIKAKRLKNFLNFLYNKYQGNLNKLLSQNIGSLRRELLDVNGIGPETADSIILYAAKKPVFVIDAYTKRIMSRHGILKNDASYEGFQEVFMKSLKKKVKMFNEYHALLVRLAKNHCKSKPDCKICPLKNI